MGPPTTKKPTLNNVESKIKTPALKHTLGDALGFAVVLATEHGLLLQNFLKNAPKENEPRSFHGQNLLSAPAKFEPQIPTTGLSLARKLML